MLSGARYTVGYSTGNEHDHALTVCLKVSKEMEDIPSQIPKPHISTELCRLVQAIPTDARPVPPSMQELKVSFQVARNPNSPFPEADFLVGIHPGVGNPLKQWPIAYFSRLSDLLVDRYRAQVVLFGGEKERESVSQLVDMMDHKHKAISLAGKTSLEEFMNMVKYCHVFIGNDSGPCHIAGVTGVPTLIISGGQVSPYEWHPLGDKTISVRLDVPCAPCYKALPEHCPNNRKCLVFLWPEKVFEAIEQLLAVSGPKE